ncbi:hypothetical protein BGZ91_011766 [Linnemannia elongata]|nr:hypothetical protein BGZ91_011766 [Linnemannia elongata]KAG0079963.1 hypothetical protein BGZ90_001184 [Linnemannia elongata]
MARKVYQTVRFMVDGMWSGEMAIFDSKPVVSDAIFKRLRNRSVHLSTEYSMAGFSTIPKQHGLDISHWYPKITASADFYTVKKYEDVLPMFEGYECRWLPC